MLRVDYITNSIFNSRTYILSDGSDKVWLVDCGDVEALLSIVGGRRVEGVLLTHAHFDHIYGLPSLLERFPDVEIYTNEWGKAIRLTRQFSSQLTGRCLQKMTI